MNKSNWNNCSEYKPNIANIDFLIRRFGDDSTIKVCNYILGWSDEGGRNCFETDDMIVPDNNPELLKQYEWCYIPE